MSNIPSQSTLLILFRVLSADLEGTIRTVIYTGRPLSVRKTPYIEEWHSKRAKEIEELTSKGIIPHNKELEDHPERSLEGRTWLMGRVAAQIHDIKPAKEIIDEMVGEAVEVLQRGHGFLSNKAQSKL